MTGTPTDFDIERLELDTTQHEDEHAHVRTLFTELSQAALRSGTLDRNRHRQLSKRVAEALRDDG